MTPIKPLLTALLASLIAFNTLADTRDINGIKVEDNASVSGTALALNGAGTRDKAIFKVYVAALYLVKKASTTDEVVSQAEQRRGAG